MKRTLLISAALALFATAASAGEDCPYKNNVQASAPDQHPQNTASAEALAPQKAQPVEVAAEAAAGQPESVTK